MTDFVSYVPYLLTIMYTKLKVKILTYKTTIDVWFPIGRVLQKYKIQIKSKISKEITNAPYFVTNYTLHRDLSMKTLTAKAAYSYKHVYNRFQIQYNPLINNFFAKTIPGNPKRRIKRN